MMKLSNKGFTLTEVLVAVAILAFSLCGILLTYINMFIWSDLSRDFTLATNAVQAKMEEVEKAGFSCLDTSHCNGCNCPSLTSCPSFRDGCTFDITGFAGSNAKGVISVAATDYPDLMRVRIVASFKSRNRVIGEDNNLNGVLDAGEDISPANTRLDSPIEMVTLVSR